MKARAHFRRATPKNSMNLALQTLPQQRTSDPIRMPIRVWRVIPSIDGDADEVRNII